MSRPVHDLNPDPDPDPDDNGKWELPAIIIWCTFIGIIFVIALVITIKAAM